MPVYDEYEDWRPPKRSKYADLDDEPKLDIKPLGRFGVGKLGAAPYNTYVPPAVQGELARLQSGPQHLSADAMRTKLERIIADAAAAAEAERVRAADEAAEAAKVEASSASRKSSKHKHSAEEKEANKEKRLLKLVGAVVVKCMSKYQKDMDHDMFKKHAKEVRGTRKASLIITDRIRS